MKQKKFIANIGFILAWMLLSVPFTSWSQQRVQFTQYMFNGLVINPAYAGADQALSITAAQRKQWANIEHSPSTQTLTAHTLFKKQHMGIGMILVNDKIGVHRNLTALSNFAYHLQVGKDQYLSMGIQAGIHNKRSNYGSLAGVAGTDPRLYDASVTYTAFDMGMGLYYRSPRLHFGISAPQLLPERFTLNDTVAITLRNINSFVFGKYRITLNENIDLEPCILLKYFEGTPLSYDFNLNLVFKKVLTTGVSYRRKESVDFMLKMQLTPQLQFGYSYDHPIGEVARVSNGSHELTINYVFRFVKSKVMSPR